MHYGTEIPEFKEKFDYTIKTIKHYPDDGNHLECDIGLPCFEIRKGEDGYYWRDRKGDEHKYNMFKDENKIDDRWIAHLTDSANYSLKKIFNPKISKDLDKVIEYCYKMYVKSLKLEIKRLNIEISKYE